MIYVLMLWTAVAANGDSNYKGNITYDWRPIAEFTDDASNKCEAAARSLGINPNRYRCVRTK